MARVFGSLRVDDNVRRKKKDSHHEHLYAKSEIFKEAEEVLILEPYVDLHVVVNQSLIEEIEPTKLSISQPYLLVSKSTIETKLPLKKKPKKNEAPQSKITELEFSDILIKSVKELSNLGDSSKYSELNVLLQELPNNNIQPWRNGYEALSCVTLKPSKGFWKEAQLLQSNEDIIEETVIYLSSFAPPIFLTISQYEKKYCAAELLRHILNELELYVEKNAVEIGAKSSKNIGVPCSNTDTLKPTVRQIQILYYVSGYTVYSTSRSLSKKYDILNILAIKGSEEDIKKYLNQELPDLNIVNWVTANNRGGLLYVRKETFIFFQMVDQIVDVFYNGTALLKENLNRMSNARDEVMKNQKIIYQWNSLFEHSQVPNDKIGSILKTLIEIYLRLRGKGLQLFLRAKYFGKKKANEKAQTSLRKGLKEIKGRKLSDKKSTSNENTLVKDFSLPLKVKGIMHDSSGDIFLV